MLGRPGRMTVLCAALLASGLAGIAAAQAPPAPRAESPNFPPAGSTAVLAEKSSGSYGKTPRQITFRWLGEMAWQGRRLLAVTDGTLTFYSDREGRLVAIARGTRPVGSYDPAWARYEWPLFVGRKWPNRYRYRDHDSGKVTEVIFDAAVEAYEDVRTPAGAFKAFRILFRNDEQQQAVWYSPSAGLLVRSRAERFVSSPQGPGVREQELVSYERKAPPR